MARVEDSYWWYLGLRRLIRTALQDIAAGRRPPTILDDGCGTGGGMAMLRRAFPESLIVGLDMAASAAGYSSRRGAGSVLLASANSLPLRDATFDGVVITDVLNVAAVDDRAALREAYRVLRPGGLLVANVPAFEWLRGAHDAAVHTSRRYRRAELRRLLVEHGFTVNRLMYWNALLLPIVFAVRRLRRPAGRGHGPPASDLVPLPRTLNWLLTRMLVVDGWLCCRLRLPFGTSLFSIAAKPA